MYITFTDALCPEALLQLSTYIGLFLIALVAATILPAQSEAALILLLRTGEYSTSGLLLAASLGNVLGSVINYVLGWWAESFRDHRWFPVKQKSLERSKNWYHRYGKWSLLLSWAPIIGDPITVAAGFMREPFWSFLVLVVVAKVGRYLALAALTLSWV